MPGDCDLGGGESARPSSTTMPVPGAIQHRALADLRREDFAGIQRCEAAFVVLLSSPLNEWILQRRDALRVLGNPAAQPVPHVTALFLGNRTPAQLWRATDVIESVFARQMDVTLGSFGLFGAGPIVTNLHCKVEPPAAVLALHDACLQALDVIGETSDSPYVRARYTPHVSVFDRISADRLVVESLLPRSSSPLRGSTTEMAIMWKTLKSVHDD